MSIVGKLKSLVRALLRIIGATVMIIGFLAIVGTAGYVENNPEYSPLMLLVYMAAGLLLVFDGWLAIRTSRWLPDQ